MVLTFNVVAPNFHIFHMVSDADQPLVVLQKDPLRLEDQRALCHDQSLPETASFYAAIPPPFWFVPVTAGKCSPAQLGTQLALP